MRPGKTLFFKAFIVLTNYHLSITHVYCIVTVPIFLFGLVVLFSAKKLLVTMLKEWIYRDNF